MIKRKIVTQKDFLYLAASSFVVVAAWIGFTLYHTWVTSTITPDLQIQIQPISPDFDTATIEGLKARRKVAPVFEIKNSSTAQPVISQASAAAIPKSDQIITIQGQ